MADVDLSVAVTSSGVSQAIAALENLRSKGLQTSSALGGLSTASSTVMAALSRSAAATTQQITKIDGYGKAMNAASRATAALNRELTEQEKRYSALARLDPNGTATSRLTRAGGAGGLASGMALALQVENRNLAQNASLTRDRQTKLREDQALLDARTQKLGAMARVERATWEQSLNGMTATHRTQAILTRATQEYAAAQKAVAQAFIQQRNASGQFLPFTTAQINAQTQALNQEAAALRAVASAEDSHRNSNNNAFQSSYSYFILAGLATQASQAIFGVGSASTTASAEIGRAFADVDRTFDGTSAQLDGLRAKLFELSTSTPTTFVDLAQIAALGNQLGIAAADIQNFTTVIAQYSAISGQSAEDSATAFGKIANLTGLTASEYSNLASAIIYTARTTVATEATIQRTSQEIAALASGAGFSAEAIVGLAGSLSSLAIPPERARGALSLYFGALNAAVAEGGPKLEAFATLTGKTTAELNKLVRENRGQEVFTSFISGLSKLDSVAKTTALDTLGLSTIRVDQTMRALAQNVPLVTKSFDGAAASYEENSERARQYAVIQATLSSKITEFQNAIQNAAGAVGNAFAPELARLLSITTEVISAMTAFAATPMGQTTLKLAVTVGVIVGAIAALVGVLALAKASMVVFSFAMSGLGWTTASTGFRGLIAGLVSTDVAARKTAFSMTGLKVAMAETSLAAGALRVGVVLLRAALGLLAIGAIIALFTAFDQAINRAQYAVDGLGGSVDELATAMRADNPGQFAEKVSETGDKAGTAATGVDSLNSAVASAVDAQIDAKKSIDGTNKSLDAQKLSVGAATDEWIKNAVLQSDALQGMLDVTRLDGSSGAQDLQNILAAGFDIGEFSTLAYTSGQRSADDYYTGWLKALQEKAASGNKDAQDALQSIYNLGGSMRPGTSPFAPIAEGVANAKVQAAVAAAITGTEVAAAAGTQAVDQYGRALVGVTEEAVALSGGFLGATPSLEAFQDAVQSGIKDFTSFKTVLGEVSAAQKVAGDETGIVNASAFGEGLKKANAEAVTFFSGLQTLAASGKTSFATQLAELGPEASDILASSLALDGSAQGELEAAARFAAFLASDAFKTALKTEMADSNKAYALIFGETGDLGQVQSLIAAQVAGTSEEWERQWLINHPTLPLNISPNLSGLTVDEIATMNALLSKQITVTPNIVFDRNGRGRTGSNTFTDSLTGNSIILPATLDGAALTSSLAIWRANQNATPQEIAAKLNKSGMSADLDAWRKTHGNVTVQVKFNIPLIKLPPVQGDGSYFRAKGGIIPDNTPRFASGGSWGQFRGPGTGTSDSILARVSAGEYINTADSTKFWGPDFFDSLNRKMLPTSFLNMLGAAASSGNSGPSHVAHVQVVQNNPLTRDPLKQLRESSEMVAAGIWGS